MSTSAVRELELHEAVIRLRCSSCPALALELAVGRRSDLVAMAESLPRDIRCPRCREGVAA